MIYTSANLVQLFEIMRIECIFSKVMRFPQTSTFFDISFIEK
jgi:hypothetical protein